MGYVMGFDMGWFVTGFAPENLTLKFRNIGRLIIIISYYKAS